MSKTSDLIRHVGMLEKLYIARKVLGIDHSVIVTATYIVRSKLEDTFLYSTLCATIPRLLDQHPSLCCYVEGEDTFEPKFKRLDIIELKDVLQNLDIEKPEDLAQKLQELHDQPWPIGQKPLWKLVVMKEKQISSGTNIFSKLYIAFVYHHVIGDGLSGTAFHRSLRRELLNIEQLSENLQEPPKAIDTPVPTRMVEPIEKLTAFPFSWAFLIQRVAREYGPRWLFGAPPLLWTGLPVQLTNECTFRSRVRIVTIEGGGLESLLEESKKHSVTLTSLLTATIVSALADALPEAPGFLGVTPYTLRRVTGTSMDDMVNQTSAFATSYPAGFLDHTRKAANATERIESLWHTAGYFHAQMQDELARCPRDNIIGLLRYVSNLIKFYQKKIGEAREATFELSNLGVFNTQESTSAIWKLENMTFTQGAQPMGPAFNVKCVTVQGGPLTITITWQDSVVHEDIIDALAHDFIDLPRLLQREPSI